MSTPTPDYGKLLPCPFCGSPARIAHGTGWPGEKIIECSNDEYCRASMTCIWMQKTEQELWNTRAGIPDPVAHLANLNKELAELREWKRQQLEVESQWDCQKVGKLLGVPLGANIRPHIEPKIANLNATIEQQTEKLKVMNAALKEAHRIFGNLSHSQVVQRLCPDFAEVAELVRKSHDQHA